MTPGDGFEISWVSERHLRVRAGGDTPPTSVATHRRVRGLYDALKGAGIAGVRDIVPAFSTVVVEFEMEGLEEGAAEEAVRGAMGGVVEREVGAGRVVEIPLCYGGEFGPDLEELARLNGMTAREVAEVHCGVEYLVHFVGFVPGFGYLGGLPEGLATPRLERPRVRVPAGSVGIAGEQTGVYPFATPGGWRLIGRTPLTMFDAGRERASVLEMGDRVRFRGVDAVEFGEIQDAMNPMPDPLIRGGGAGVLRVVDAGMMTTVQDLGRPGLGAIGVCGGGAADWGSLIAGNRLLGNEEGAAGLEMTLRGCVVETDREVEVVVSGAGAVIHGRMKREVGERQVVRVEAGERVAVERIAGARAYLCVGGGIDVPRVLGSRGTHLSAGFGGVGRALKVGDEVAIGSGDEGGAQVSRHRGAGGTGTSAARVAWPRALRLVVNECGGFDAGEIATFLGAEYRVASQSDRVGIRLEGPRIAPESGGRMISEGMMWGAVQVPEDGRPIVLNVDYPVTGGYPVIGCVAAADQPVLGQLKPGDGVRFEAVTRGEARGLWKDVNRELRGGER